MCKSSFILKTTSQKRSILSILLRLIVSTLVLIVEVIGIIIFYYSFRKDMNKKRISLKNNNCYHYIDNDVNAVNNNSNNNTSNSNSNNIDIKNDKVNDLNESNNYNNNNNDNNDNNKDNNIKISIIIPLRNCARTIGKTIQTLEIMTRNKKQVEIILVDGGTDNSINVAKSSSLSIPLKIIKSNNNNNDSINNRGFCNNIGYNHANGEILIFIKPDVLLPYQWDEKIINTFEHSKNFIIGFRHGIDRKSLQYIDQEPPALTLIEKYYDWRFFCSMILPTNAISIRKKDFTTRQFQNILLFEDLEFINRIRLECLANGKNIVLLHDECLVNGKKYEALGVLKSSVMDILSSILFLIFKMNPNTIYNICYDFIPNKIKYRF